jgi:hypothetical protein
VAGGALGLAEEEEPAPLLLRGQGRVIPLEIAVERRAGLGELLHLERGQRPGRLVEAAPADPGNAALNIETYSLTAMSRAMTAFHTWAAC